MTMGNTIGRNPDEQFQPYLLVFGISTANLLWNAAMDMEIISWTKPPVISLWSDSGELPLVDWLRSGLAKGQEPHHQLLFPILLSLRSHLNSTPSAPLLLFVISFCLIMSHSQWMMSASMLLKKIVRRMWYLICKYYGSYLRADSSVSPSWNPYLLEMDYRKRDIQLNKSLGRWLFWNIYKKYFPMVSFSHWIFCLWASVIKMSSHINKLHFTKALSKTNVPVHKLLVLALPIETFFTFETQMYGLIFINF